MAAVAVASGVILAMAATILFARLLQRGCGLWIALLVTLAAASASSVHYLARPHIFTILFFSLALWIIEEDRGVWLLVPITALWVNLHAGFVAWLATLGLLSGACLWNREWGRVRRYGVLAGLCGAASLANPYGWKLHEHVFQYLGSRWIVDNVQEFQSPNIRSEGMIVFALLLLAAVAFVSRSRAFEAVLVLAWGFAALRSARHIPLFAIVAAPVVASGCAEIWRGAAAPALRTWWELGQDLARSARVSLCLPVSAAIVLFSAPSAGFPESRFPVDAVRTNAARLAPANAMPRILTSDQWADYLIFQLYPRQRVFFDGRSDFFGPSLGADYRALMTADRSWRQLMDRYGFDLALLPHDWPLSTALEKEPGWHRVYEDRVGVLLARQGGTQ